MDAEEIAELIVAMIKLVAWVFKWMAIMGGTFYFIRTVI